jgi:hypothetical protein
MKTNRRNFLESMGFGAVGMGVLTSEIKAIKIAQDECITIMKPYLAGTVIPGIGKGDNPRNVKINVKLVYYALIHQGSWEGPCRYRGPNLCCEEEKEIKRNAFEKYVPQFEQKLSPDAQMLDPVYFEFPEFKKITRQDIMKLEEDKDDVDLYVVKGQGLVQYFAAIVGEIYKKPVLHSRDAAAYLRSRGLEGYVESDHGGMDKLISLLRARKIFQHTNILLITDIGIPGYPQTSSVRNFDELNKRFGIGATVIGYNELADERERIRNSSSCMEEVDKLTEKLIENAQRVHLGKNQFVGDILVYQAIKNLMKKHSCNAFTLECFEWCGSRQPDLWKAVPCITHSLLRDEGYPSACEGDVCALLALDVFMGLANKSAYMGNFYLLIKDYEKKELTGQWGGGGKTEQWGEGIEVYEDKIWIGHNVPGLKMLGFDKPDLSYELRNFIMDKVDEPGWGGTIKTDFTKIPEKTVTIGRFNPLATKMLITKGEVVGQGGYENTGCSTGIIIEIPDPKGYAIKTSDYGHHFALTYGDYTQDLIQFGKMLKIEIELHI